MYLFFQENSMSFLMNVEFESEELSVALSSSDRHSSGSGPGSLPRRLPQRHQLQHLQWKQTAVFQHQCKHW